MKVAVLVFLIPFLALAQAPTKSDAETLRKWKKEFLEYSSEWYTAKRKVLEAEISRAEAFWRDELTAWNQVTDPLVRPRAAALITSNRDAQKVAFEKLGRQLSVEYNSRVAFAAKIEREVLSQDFRRNVSIFIGNSVSETEPGRAKANDDWVDAFTGERHRVLVDYVSLKALDTGIEKFPSVAEDKGKKVFMRFVLNGKELAPWENYFRELDSAFRASMRGTPSRDLAYDANGSLLFRGAPVKITFHTLVPGVQTIGPDGSTIAGAPQYVRVEDSKTLDESMDITLKEVFRHRRLLTLLGITDG